MKCRCAVCELPLVRPALLCSACARSFDYLRVNDDGTIHSVLAWAAKRAHLFERRRVRARSRS